MRVITATREAQLFLGKQGENLATQIVFPYVEEWGQTYGEGRFELAYQRPTEESPYPCVVEVDEHNVTWNITSTEVAIPGTGRAELFYIVDEAVAISVQFICRVVSSLANGTPPEPWENWLEEILEAGADAESARDDAESARDDAVQAKNDAVDAKDLAVSSADSASADAIRAETARSYAELANDTAQTAKTYAVDAKDVAVAAAADALSAKEDAVDASTSALGAASDAETYMQQALEAKEDAEDAKASALGAVNDVANYANTASTAAASALHSAEVASQMAENIEEVIPQHKGEYSATTAYKMNDIVSYNGATYWHYAAAESKGKAPTNADYWVLMNSATKSIASISKTGTAGLVDTYTISYTDNSTPSSFTVTNGQRGTNIGTGDTLPASGMITGDLYVKTPSYELYQYSGSAWSLVGSIPPPIDNTLTEADEAAEAKAVGDALATKADNDGYYEDLSVGRADNIIANVKLTDRMPYTLRTAGGALEISDPISEKMIVGMSGVWNQRESQQVSSSTSVDGYIRSNAQYMSLTLTASTRTYTLSSDVDASHYKNARSNNAWITDKHIYYVCADVKVSDSSTWGGLSLGTNSADGGGAVSLFGLYGPTNGFVPKATIKKATHSTWTISRFFMRLNNAAPANSYAQFRDIQIIDLNRVFGTEIAEYLLARETASAGAGVSIFRSLFPNKYYAKNTGSWYNTNLSKKISVGFNAYNATTGKATVVAKHNYRIEGAYTSYTYTPFNGTATTVLATDEGASEPNFPWSGVVQFTGADEDLCMHLAWDGERDGEKEDYKENVYEFDSDVTLRGFPKIDDEGNIYTEGDTYEPDGKITRHVGYTTINTLNWNYDSVAQVFYADIENMKMGGNLWLLSTFERYTGDISDMPNRTYWNDEEVYSSHNLVVKNTAYSLVTDFLSAYGANAINYELETPTTEEGDPYAETQRVDNWGTEQFVDYAYEHNTRDVSIPYGHVTLYPQDLKAKIEVAPDAPENDGDYLMRREDGANSYVPHESELPELPSSGSAYTLMCDASGSSPSLSWVQPFVIIMTDDGEGGYVVDKTMQEINVAYYAGQRLVLVYNSMQAELTYMNTDLYTFMFTYENWLIQGNIKYYNTTYVEVKRSVILDGTGLDDFGRTPCVWVYPTTQEAHIKWAKKTFTIDTTYDSQNGRWVTIQDFGDISNEDSISTETLLYCDGHYSWKTGFSEGSNGTLYVYFQEFDSYGSGIWTLVCGDNDDPCVVIPPTGYLASAPFVITLTQSAFVFTYDKTIAEIAEAYQQGRQIWLQGTVTSDGVNFFDFTSQLNGVVKVGDGSQFGNPVYTFVVEYDTRGSGIYHTVISLYTNNEDEDDCHVSAKIIQ